MEDSEIVRESVGYRKGVRVGWGIDEGFFRRFLEEVTFFLCF